MRGAGAAVIGWALFASACGESDTTFELVFPNEIVLEATERIRIDIAPRSGRVSPCADFARRGIPPPRGARTFQTSCSDREGPCPDGWLDALVLPGVPARARARYVEVRGFPSRDRAAEPWVVGCVDPFEPRAERARVELEIVIPADTRLQLVSGHGQVGEAHQMAAAPLAIRVRAFPEAGPGRTGFDVPGVRVRFEVESGDVRLAEGSTLTALTGADGVARAPFRFGDVETSRIRGSLPRWSELFRGAEPTVRAWVSVVPPLEPRSFRTVGVARHRVVDLALGDVDGDRRTDLAVLGCAGSAPCEVRAASAPGDAFGDATLQVAAPLVGESELGPVLRLEGWAPAGVAIVDAVPDEPRAEIVVVEARDRRCRVEDCPEDAPCRCQRSDGAACPCEGAVIGTWGLAADGVLESRWPRRPTNAFNALGLSTFVERGGSTLAVVHRGRFSNRRPCVAPAACAPACPAGETCRLVEGRPRCTAPSALARIFDFEEHGWVARADCGCLARDPPPCAPERVPASIECNRPRDAWATSDACGRRTLVGVPAAAAGVTPISFDVATISRVGGVDLLTGSDRSLELTTLGAFGEVVGRASILVDQRVIGLAGAQLDASVDGSGPADRGGLGGDVVWWSDAPCRPAPAQCPTMPPRSSDAVGCVGVMLTAGEPNVGRVDPSLASSCRRHDLAFRPDHGCLGDFNGDGHPDLVWSGDAAAHLAFGLGDGHGGFALPPRRVALPDGDLGGPLACADVDGDGHTDVVVVSSRSGVVRVYGAGS